MIMNTNFSYTLVDHLGTVSSCRNGEQTLEVNLISYNGSEPKIDIRRWNRQNNRMLKGVTLSKEEAIILRNILQDVQTETE